MKNQEEHLKDLAHIRSMMEQSSRFISLSGLSGIFTGIYALIGALVAHWYTGIPFGGSGMARITFNEMQQGRTFLFLLFLAAIILLFSVGTAIWLTTRKARKKGLKVWNKPAMQLVKALMIPLITGGVFCAGLIYHGHAGFTASAMLIFYGLALINAAKYTLHDIWFLGISQTILGLMAMFFTGYGLLFWTLGFGILHIIYGIVMYLKYEHKATA